MDDNNCEEVEEKNARMKELYGEEEFSSRDAVKNKSFYQHQMDEFGLKESDFF